MIHCTCGQSQLEQVTVPAMQIMMPLGLPAAPSQTATMTPLVSTNSEKPSNFEGTFFSMLTASRAVTTGIADLQRHVNACHCGAQLEIRKAALRVGHPVLVCFAIESCTISVLLTREGHLDLALLPNMTLL